MRPLPQQLPLALGWMRFHIARGLRRPGTWAPLAAIVGLAALLRVGPRADPDEIAATVLLLALPLVAMLLATGGLREEVEDQTLTYAFIRPLGRAWIYFARAGAAAAFVFAACATALVVAGGNAIEVVRHLGAALAATAAYVAVFSLLGLLLRRPTLTGLAWLGWELSASDVPGFLAKLTLRTHVRAIADLPAEGILGALQSPPPPLASLGVIAAVTAAALAAGHWRVRHRELVVPK